MKWFRVANDAPTSHHVAATLAQTAVFWTTFLVVLPWLVVSVERELLCLFPALYFLGPHPWVTGIPLLLAASALGLWTGLLMAVRGRGTPLPLVAARDLVCTGPYRVVRNPMALAGITQGIAVGYLWISVPVVLYALAGALLWHVAARPAEEQFLSQRFGAAFTAYRERVPLWVPRLLPRRGERWLGVSIATASVATYVWLVVPSKFLRLHAPASDLWNDSLFAAYGALPLPVAGVLVGTLLWTRNRAPAITASPRTQ